MTVPTGSNTPDNERDEWRTPRWLFLWLDQRFGFDIDLAASDENALVDNYLTIDTDALQRPWHGLWQRGYCNCPYSNIDPWVDKAIQEMDAGFLTVMVMPSFNGEERFCRVFDFASEVIDIIGRVAFLRPDGTPVSGNTRGTSVYVFDPHRLTAACQRWHVRRDRLIERHENNGTAHR